MHIRFTHALLLIPLAALLLTACTTTSSEVTGSGFAVGDGTLLSLAVAQARAQYPELSAEGFPYALREGKPGTAAPELALQGEGSGFSRGLQLQDRGKGWLKLFLDKSSYARGYALVTIGGAEQRWPIVAYELRGKASERFEFSYLLSAPGEGLRYLVVLGGTYGSGVAERLAYEGILLIPAAGKPLDEWGRAFKFDFGFKYPARPEYFAGVDQAEALFRELQRDVSGIAALSERMQKVQADAAAAKAAATLDSARKGPDPAALEARAAEMKSQLEAKAAETEAKALRYYEVRTAVDQQYATFVLTNPYRWRDLAGQTEFYQRWQKVEFHHPAIDNLVENLGMYLQDAKKLKDTRATAMALFAKNNNWDKDPGRQAEGPADKPAAKPQ